MYNIHLYRNDINISKLVVKIAAIIIGVGFIVIATSNILRSEIASILQDLLGVVFIVSGLYKTVSEIKKIKQLYYIVNKKGIDLQ